MDSRDFDWSIACDPEFQKQLHISNAADRDDAIQDACLKLLKRSICVTRQVLLTTAYNCNKDHIKSEYRRKRRERHRAVLQSPEEYRQFDAGRDSSRLRMPLAENGDMTEQDPSARLQRREMRAAIKRAVRAAGLTRDHRCALWAWSRDHIAKLANRREIHEVTIRVRAKRARDVLGLHLEREGLGPE